MGKQGGAFKLRRAFQVFMTAMWNCFNIKQQLSCFGTPKLVTCSEHFYSPTSDHTQVEHIHYCTYTAFNYNTITCATIVLVHANATNALSYKFLQGENLILCAEVFKFLAC